MERNSLEIQNVSIKMFKKITTTIFCNFTTEFIGYLPIIAKIVTLNAIEQTNILRWLLTRRP